MLASQKKFPRGFTFVELMMGMVVTALVLSALSVFVFGVADAWTGSESAQSIFLSGNMAVDHIDRAVRQCTAIDPNATPGNLNNSGAPAACMLWHDDNGDGLIQYSEMSLLQYVPASQTIQQYDVVFPPLCNIASVNVIEPSLLTPAVFAASTYGVATPVAHNITACEMVPVTTAAGERPSLEIVLKVGSGTAQTTLYTTATVRSPRKLP